MAEQNQLARFIRNDSVQQRINSLLDKRASQFTTSLITIANTNNKIAQCEPSTVLNAALTAASMDLPLNPNLGFAYIVPYGREAQFQMGWKGYVQLAQRSGRYKTISAAPVYEGQLVSNDPLKGITFDWSVKETGAPVGYVAYFELLNGFEKTLYMSAEQMEKHAKRYSKAFTSGPWKTDYDKMAMKTVLKLLINRFGPMSTELEQAMVSDQAVLGDTGPKYVDNGDDLDDVKATEDKKAAIIAANTDEGEVVDPPKNIGDLPEETPENPAALAEEIMGATAQPAKPAPAKKKVNIKEEVERRGWNKDGKQTKLVNDEAPDNNGS